MITTPGNVRFQGFYQHKRRIVTGLDSRSEPLTPRHWVRDTVVVLSGPLGRTPRPSEIAAHLDITTALVIDTLRAAHAHTTTSLDAPSGSKNLPLAEHLGHIDEELELMENRAALKTAFKNLPARERDILVLRFFADMTQTQIGAELGISQMHVSRLLTRTLATLRGRISTSPAPERPRHG